MRSSIVTRPLLLLLAVIAFTATACSGGEDSSPTPVPNPETVNAADLSGLDASETEAEILRLLTDGHWMYIKLRVFPGARDLSPIPPPCYDEQYVCDILQTYPEVTIEESWEATDPQGRTLSQFGRKSAEDGTVLATGFQGEWVDLATGQTWVSRFVPGIDLAGFVSGSYTKIDREFERGLEGVEGELLGRPSMVFPEGEFEYQVANPMIQRITKWQDDGNGGRMKLSEVEVLDFAMLPPDVLPDFAPRGME